MLSRVLLAAVLGCALLRTVSADDQKEAVIEGDDNSEISLTQPTLVGHLTLQPGTYVVKHHVSHGQHFIRFLRVERTEKLRLTRAYTGWYTETELIKVGEIKCRVEPQGAKVPVTKLTVSTDSGKPQITRVMIKGKAAVYVF